MGFRVKLLVSPHTKVTRGLYGGILGIIYKGDIRIMEKKTETTIWAKA